MKNNSRSSMCRYNNNIVILYVNYDALFACVVLNILRVLGAHYLCLNLVQLKYSIICKLVCVCVFCYLQMLALEASMERERCALHDRQVRLHSVHTDLGLDLPTSIHLPDGEELPYGSSTRLHIRDAEQVSRPFIFMDIRRKMHLVRDTKRLDEKKGLLWRAANDYTGCSTLCGKFEVLLLSQ